VIKLVVQFYFSFYNFSSEGFKMDRFLVKTKNKTTDLEEDSTQEAVSETFVAGKSAAKKPRTTGGSESSSETRKPRSYNSEYRKFGFCTNGSVLPLLPLCVIC
jgi:hypothetical protein